MYHFNNKMINIFYFFPVECEKLETDVAGVCPVGFPDECHEFCYKITHTTAENTDCGRATWDEAQKNCAKIGGRVLSIRNEKDQRCLEKYIEKSTSGMWIGLYEEFDALTNTGKWRWLDDGTQYQGSYQNWDQGRAILLRLKIKLITHICFYYFLSIIIKTFFTTWKKGYFYGTKQKHESKYVSYFWLQVNPTSRRPVTRVNLA